MPEAAPDPIGSLTSGSVLGCQGVRRPALVGRLRGLGLGVGADHPALADIWMEAGGSVCLGADSIFLGFDHAKREGL